MEQIRKILPEYFMVLFWQFDVHNNMFRWHIVERQTMEEAIELHDNMVQRSGLRQVTVIHLPKEVVDLRPDSLPHHWEALVVDRAQIVGAYLHLSNTLLDERSDWRSAAAALKARQSPSGYIPTHMRRNAAAFAHDVTSLVAEFVQRRHVELSPQDPSSETQDEYEK